MLTIILVTTALLIFKIQARGVCQTCTSELSKYQTLNSNQIDISAVMGSVFTSLCSDEDQLSTVCASLQKRFSLADDNTLQRYFELLMSFPTTTAACQELHFCEATATLNNLKEGPVTVGVSDTLLSSMQERSVGLAKAHSTTETEPGMRRILWGSSPKCPDLPSTGQGYNGGCNNLEQGKSCWQGCTAGYIKTAGTGLFTCHYYTDHYELRGSLTCSASTCNLSPPSGAGYDNQCAGLVSGQSCTPTCSVGYTRSGLAKDGKYLCYNGDLQIHDTTQSQNACNVYIHAYQNLCNGLVCTDASNTCTGPGTQSAPGNCTCMDGWNGIPVWNSTTWTNPCIINSKPSGCGRKEGCVAMEGLSMKMCDDTGCVIAPKIGVGMCDGCTSLKCCFVKNAASL